MADRGAPVVTVAQMVAAEQRLFDAGMSVDALMQRAGRGAGELIWRIGGKAPTLVLCGPGNNGGDGYVIAEFLREKGVPVEIAALAEPHTEAARNARAAFQGRVIALADARPRAQLVDCLFGSGLTRPLAAEVHAHLFRFVAEARRSFAIDLPSGVDADGAVWRNDPIRFDHVLALGAWKYAHLLEPTASDCGVVSLVAIGVAFDGHRVRRIAKPLIQPPSARAHKYSRGLVAIVAGAMAGAAVLAARAAQQTGAGYVKLIGAGDPPSMLPADLVWERADTPDALAARLADPRIGTVLVGPGLGRNDSARALLDRTLASPHPLVIDADAIHLVADAGAKLAQRSAPTVLTPHHGEFTALAREPVGVESGQNKADRAAAMADALGAHLFYKGADSVLAVPGGALVIADRRCGWLSVAGTGDVLAGCIAARLAAHRDPLAAMAEAAWLHDRAARLAGPAFAASQLADALAPAVDACLAR